MRFPGDFWTELVNLTVEMAPYLLLGFLFAGILYAWLPAGKITRYLGKNNVASVVNASLLGIPLPLCSCGVIPTGISFYRSGASKGASVSFLISTPQTGVDSILVTWSLLGLPMAIIRPVIALFTGIMGGLLTNSAERKNASVTAPDNSSVLTEKQKTGIIGMLKYAFVDFLQDIVKWLVIGLLIAAALAVIIPDDFFLKYLSNDYLSMAIVLLASIPLYVCATGSVPIAAVLLMKGLSPGAAIVFLMAGPATNAATISVIANALGRKTLFNYLFSIITGAVLFGIIVNELLPREWFTSAIHNIHSGEHAHEILPYWFQTASAVVLTALLINGLLMKYLPSLFHKKIRTSKSKLLENMSVQQFNVEGMTCNHCRMTVETNLMKLPGLTSVKADIITGKVTVEGESIRPDKIKETVNALGYRFVS